MTINVNQEQGNYIVQIPRISTTATLAQVTAAGWLNSAINEGFVIPASCKVLIAHDQGSAQAATNFFNISITLGVYTLSLSEADVILPVVSGDFAVFSGTAGALADSGSAPSVAAQPYVVMSPGSLTVGNIPFLNDANGTLNTGRAPSAATAGYKVAMSPGSLTAGNLMKLADANGTIADQGVAMKSVAGAAAAGGNAAQSFTDAFCTSGSCVVGNWNTQANAASVLKIVPGNGSFVVTSSADAGVGTFNYIITK